MIGRWVYGVFICVAVLGAILLIVGGILVPVFRNEIYNKQVGNTSFYFFNVSNPDEIVKTGKNTTVNQIGPYVYRLTLKMKHVAVSHSRLSYDFYKKYTFDEGMSVGNETDDITTVNLPILNLATRLLWTNKAVEQNVSELIGHMKESLFKQIRLSNLLWGYVDQNVVTLCDFLKHNFSINPLDDTNYGLLYQSGQQHKTTFEGSFEVSRGRDNASDRWALKKWNGNSSLDVWNSPKCNRIKGTDGYAWPPGPGLNDSETSYIFDSDWCRSIDLVSTDPKSKLNRPTIKYKYRSDAFGYGGWRRGFCQPTPSGNKSSCLEGGVLNVTKCKNNIPLLLSQPHFLDADSSYTKAIHGLNPDPKHHATYFKIDQSSGEVVEGSRKLQLNAYVTKLASFPDTANFADNPTVIPIAWMEEVYSMTKEEKESLIHWRKIYDEIQYSLIGIGAVLLVFALLALVVVFLLNSWRPGGERQPLLGH